MADAVQEGDSHALPPTLPPIGAPRHCLQPIFKHEPDGPASVQGNLDPAATVCGAYRANPERFRPPEDSAIFLKANDFYSARCVIWSGRLTSARDVIMEGTRRFHVAGFNIHVHTIGELAIKTTVDAIEAARAADGAKTTHDALAHVQNTSPDDAARIGKVTTVMSYSGS